MTHPDPTTFEQILLLVLFLAPFVIGFLEVGKHD